MPRQFYSKALAAAILLIVVLLGVGVTGALCGEPPGGFKYTGKGIDAVLTLTILPVGNSEVVVGVLLTECNGETLTFGPFVDDFVTGPGALVNAPEEELVDELIGYAPPGCFSAAGGEELRISNVYEFYNSADYVTDCNTGLTVPRGALGAHVELNTPQ